LKWEYGPAGAHLTSGQFLFRLGHSVQQGEL